LQKFAKTVWNFSRLNGQKKDCDDKHMNKRKTMEYTCTDYRAEMMLLGLKLRLEKDELDDEEREALLSQIRKIEEQMGLG